MDGERQSVYADPRSTHFSKLDTSKSVPPVLLSIIACVAKSDRRSNRNGNEVFELPRKIVGKMGIPHYGVSMVAYTKDANGIKIWVAKRAESKSL